MIHHWMRLLGAAAVAGCIASSALAQSAPTLSSQAQAALEGWRAMMQGQKALIDSLPPASTVSEELARRIALEQAGRLSLSVVRRNLSTEDGLAVTSAVITDITALDAEFRQLVPDQAIKFDAIFCR